MRSGYLAAITQAKLILCELSVLGGEHSQVLPQRTQRAQKEKRRGCFIQNMNSPF